MTYQEKLKSPVWQKRRLEILERDDWTCMNCYETEKTLHVHHKYYVKNVDPWDYPDYALISLCESCHKEAENERQRFNIFINLLILKDYTYSSIVKFLANAVNSKWANDFINGK